MISVVCGLIGAGKSTYSEEQGGIISDFDLIGDKDAQLMLTLSEHKKVDMFTISLASQQQKRWKHSKN